MPVIKCSNGKCRIGSGDCIYTSRASAERAYAGYRAQKYGESTERTLRDWIDIVEQNQSQTLAEAFTDPYPVELKTVSDQRYQADAVLDDGTNLQIAFELNDDDPDHGEHWGVEFLRDDEQGKTGEKRRF